MHREKENVGTRKNNSKMYQQMLPNPGEQEKTLTESKNAANEHITCFVWFLEVLTEARELGIGGGGGIRTLGTVSHTAH